MNATSAQRRTASPDAKGRVAPAAPGGPAPRTLVIGFGSPIRGDDAIGPLVAERLASEPLAPGTRVLARHVLTAELAEDLATAERAIFLDAALSGTPGEVEVIPLAPDGTTQSTMAHFLDPRELLAWCQALYHRVPEAWLVSAAGEFFGYANCRLSPSAQAAAEAMLGEARRLIRHANSVETESGSAG